MDPDCVNGLEGVDVLGAARVGVMFDQGRRGRCTKR